MTCQPTTQSTLHC